MKVSRLEGSQLVRVLELKAPFGPGSEDLYLAVIAMIMAIKADLLRPGKCTLGTLKVSTYVYHVDDLLCLIYHGSIPPNGLRKVMLSAGQRVLMFGNFDENDPAHVIYHGIGVYPKHCRASWRHWLRRLFRPRGDARDRK